jgi:hypothetical protein
LFLGMIVFCVINLHRDNEMEFPGRAFLLISVYSLVVLARVLVRVPAGGANSAAFMPVPLLLFIYIMTSGLPVLAASAAARRYVRRTVSVLLSISMAVALGVFSYRQTKSFDFRLQTPQGGLRLRPSLGLAMNQALMFISRNTAQGEYILALPEGSSLNFLADRPMPLRHEIITPGFLTEAAEQQAIRRIQEKNVRYIFLFNRPTLEFGLKAFGRDYCRTLMGWIESNYEVTDVFGEQVSPKVEIGDPHFFIKCYSRKEMGGQ